MTVSFLYKKRRRINMWTVAVKNKVILAKNIIEAWNQSLRLVLKNGEIIWDKNEKLLEVFNVNLIIKKPGRNKNLLKPYFKEFGLDPFERIQKLFEDSRVKNKELKISYAQRIYKYRGKNQLEKIIQKLKVNPYSKSATFTLFDPIADEKHVPCIAILDFKIRHKKLFLTVFARSSDATKKLPADLFALTKIQKQVASSLRIKTGVLTMFIASLHVYERDFDALYRVVTRWRWNRKATTWDEETQDPGHYVNIENGYQRFLMFLEDCLGEIKAENILDVACGTGAVASFLFKKAKKIYGIDLAPQMIKVAKQKNPQINFKVGDALDLPYKDSFFDVVVSRGVLISHLLKGSKKKLIKEYSRVIKPGGFLIFDFLQNISSEESIEKEKAILNKEKIKKFLLGVGFKILAFESKTETRVNSVCAKK